MLDGIVFSGGEPLAQYEQLVSAMAEVKQINPNYKVGVHTSGAYPAALQRLLDSGLVDWIGLDIKALPEDYALITQVQRQKTRENLLAVMSSGIDYELRLTYPEDHPNTIQEVYDFTRELGSTAPFFVQPTNGSARYQYNK